MPNHCGDLRLVKRFICVYLHLFGLWMMGDILNHVNLLVIESVSNTISTTDIEQERLTDE